MTTLTGSFTQKGWAISQAYTNHESGMVKTSRPVRFGDVRYLSVKYNNDEFMILVHVLDTRPTKAEVKPVAGDNTCFWVPTSALMELVDPVCVNRE